jgi:hypothetical protein
MSLRPQTLVVAVLATAAMLLAPVLVARAASASTPAASAAAKKKCRAGKVLVRRPGRSSVCAKKCPAGTKRKVSRRGKLSCVKKQGATTPTGDAPAGPVGTTPTSPTTTDPAAGNYSGQTAQQRPVGFTVEGNEIKTFEAGVNTWCSTMYTQRIVFDAIANVPPMPIGSDGSFSYTGDETNGNIKINGSVTGGTATGTVGMNRGDTNYSGGQMYFGSCSASDVTWSATAG